MTTTVTKNGGIMNVDKALVDIFVNDGWKVVDKTPSVKPQKDDTEPKDEKTDISSNKDKKRFKSRFEK